MEREGMYVEIEKGIKDDFYAFVAGKHGRIKGFLWKEVQNALVYYMEGGKEEGREKSEESRGEETSTKEGNPSAGTETTSDFAVVERKDTSEKEKKEEKKKDVWRHHDKMKPLISALKEKDIDKLRELLKRLPESERVPKMYGGYVQEAEELVEEEERTESLDIEREIPKEREMEEEFSLVAGGEDLLSDRQKRYIRVIQGAKQLVEEGDIGEARKLLNSASLKGAPTEKLEQELRDLKERLGCK